MGTVDDESMAVARTLTSSVTDVSAAAQHQKPGTAGLEEVRDFYEKLPYPPPLKSLDEHRARYSVPDRRPTLFHRIWPTERPHGHQEILIAGCGTSQAARYAGRWVEQAPYLPQCGALANTGHGERLSALAPPAQHAAAEPFRGNMTQHRVIAYRSDCSSDGEAIHFSGERWRDYVPIRLPWAL